VTMYMQGKLDNHSEIGIGTNTIKFALNAKFITFSFLVNFTDKMDKTDGLRERGKQASGEATPALVADPVTTWRGPLLAGYVAPSAVEEEDSGAEEVVDEDEDAGEFPVLPPNPEDDKVLYSALLSFGAALLLAALLPLEGKSIALAGMAIFLLGCAVLIFSQGARGVLPVALGVGIACGSLGLLFGGILQEVLRFALLDLSGLRAFLHSLLRQ
jgi:hypothetical protein